MASRGQHWTPIFGINLRAIMLVIFVSALFSSTAYPQTVTFTFNLNCDNGAPGCPNSNLAVASGVGGVASDNVEIATVNSDVPGYTIPVPVNAGSLNWTSTPATQAQCMSAKVHPDYACYATYGNPGGSASILGSVFGLPPGSTLLTASFFGGAISNTRIGGDTIKFFTGSIVISYVNPVILANLGMAGLPNSGSGVLGDSFVSTYPQYQHDFSVSVTFTSEPTVVDVLHNFTGGMDGSLPYAGLTMDKAGNLYGTTSSDGGGSGCLGRGCGTVFKMSHKGSGWTFNPLYAFQGGTDGYYPQARVTVGPDGVVYGTTGYGGGSGCGGPGCGTVFSLRPPPRACTTALCPWTVTILYSFKGGADGASPQAEVTIDQAGNLYGTTYAGDQNGNGGGTVFELTPTGSGWMEKVLYNFSGAGGDGAHPLAGLIFDAAGNLYGTTATGGARNHGTVFQLSPSGSGWTEKVIYAFQGAGDGRAPSGTLIFDGSGNLYGTTYNTVYELSPANGHWTFSALYDLMSWTGVNNGSLAIDASGNLYGASTGGGFYGAGTVFKLAPSGGSWSPTVFYQFTGGGDGAYPIGVILDANGNLYSTTYSGGGSQLNGTVWEITP